MRGGNATAPVTTSSVTELAAAHGALLCTLLRWDAATESLIRSASSRPAEYPLGGSKRFERPWPEWLETCVSRQTGHAADGTAFLREAFFDHELIESLGCSGYCTVPVLAHGQLLGVLSALGPNGWATQTRLAALTEDLARHPDLVTLSVREEKR